MDQVAAQLDGMLKDPRGSQVVQRFLGQWLQHGQLDSLVKDAGLFPDWTSKQMPSVLRAQAGAFFDHVLSNEGGKLSALLTSPKVLVNQQLADYYGANSNSAFTPIDGSKTESAGILTLPALLPWPAHRSPCRPSSTCARSRTIPPWASCSWT